MLEKVNGKKIFDLVLSVVILIMLAGCMDQNQDFPSESIYPHALDLRAFSNLAADISGAAAIGIEKDDLSRKVGFERKEIQNAATEKYFLLKALSLDPITGLPSVAAEKVKFRKRPDIIGTVYDFNGSAIYDTSEVTQDDIPGQVNKMYVSGGYTFLQFVPIVSTSGIYKYEVDGIVKEGYIKLRSGQEQIDSDGISEFEKTDYYSDEIHKSYVIDNESGYMYAIEGMYIERIKDGLIKIKDDGLIYTMSVNIEDELVFSSLFQNTTVKIVEYFSDSFGQNYIQNEQINTVDASTKTIFYTQKNYFRANSGVVLHLEYSGSFNYSSMPSSYSKIAVVEDNFVERNVSYFDEFTFGYFIINDNTVHNLSHVKISHISNGIMYLYSSQGSAYSHFSSVDTASMATILKHFGVYGYAGGGWAYDCICSVPISYNKVLIWTDRIGSGSLYYADVYGPNEYDGGESITSLNMLHLLLEGCTPENGWSLDEDAQFFRVTTLRGTDYYQVILDGAGKDKQPMVVKKGSYSAGNTITIKFQPLNK